MDGEKGNNFAHIWKIKGDQKYFALGNYIIVTNTNVRRIKQKNCICSNNHATLKAVCSSRARNGYIQEYTNVLEGLATAKKANTVWVPEHSRMHSNKTDKLVRHGAKSQDLLLIGVLGRPPYALKLNGFKDNKTSYHFAGGCEGYERLRFKTFQAVKGSQLD